MHLVLDLDETLISVVLKEIPNPDFTFNINKVTYYGKKRPNLDLFLKYVFDKYSSVSVWTAGTREYAKKVLNRIMTEEQIKKLTFFKSRRDVVLVKGGHNYKPLKKMFDDPIAQRIGMTVHNTIMIDDRAEVLRDNPGNGIKIPVWRGADKDKYLSKLIVILDGILHHNLGFGHYPQVIDLKAIVG